MSLYVIPDPDTVTSGEAQEVPGFGIFPVAVSKTTRSADEWRDAIKKNHLHLVVQDIRKLAAHHKGTALELAFENEGEVAPQPADESATTTAATEGDDA